MDAVSRVKGMEGKEMRTSSLFLQVFVLQFYCAFLSQAFGQVRANRRLTNCPGLPRTKGSGSRTFHFKTESPRQTRMAWSL